MDSPQSNTYPILTNKVIAHSAHDDGIFKRVMPENVAAARVVARILDIGSLILVESDHPGSEAAPQQLGLLTDHGPGEVHLGQETV